MSQQNIALARRAFEEVYNRGELDLIDELVASDFVGHISPEEVHGPEELKQFVATLRAAFPDIHFTVEDQIAEGDRVMTRWTARATHQGEFNGIPPTGKQVQMTGVDIDRIASGKAVECWSYLDALGLMHQLDAHSTPEMVGAAAQPVTAT